MQHIEEAGVHSGDSACVLPPYKISLYHQTIVYEYVERLGLALGVKGLMNVQLAIKDDIVYVLEVNPRASAPCPTSASDRLPIAKLAAKVMAGQTLADLGFTETPHVDGFFVKEAVLPFRNSSAATIGLRRMRSTGEVMGHAPSFGHASPRPRSPPGRRCRHRARS